MSINFPSSPTVGDTVTAFGKTWEWNGTGWVIQIPGGAEPSIAAGTTSQYWRGDKTWRDLATDVRAALLTGLSTATSAVITATDTVLGALGKLQAQINSLGTAAKVNTGRTTGNVPIYEDFSSINRGNPGLMLEASSGGGRVGISGGLGETDADGQAVFAFNAIGSASVASSGEKRLGIFFFNTDGSTSGNRGCAFGINLKKNGVGSISNTFGISNAGVVTPGTDNSQSMGSSSLRWSVVYAGTGSINTSDARDKTAVAPMTEDEIDAATELSREIGTYKWIESVQAKGADARLHVGLTVQRAIEILQAHGLDPFHYGFICFDQWGEQDAVTDNETGEVVRSQVAAGDRYSFRHDELLLFMARGIDARLAALEAADTN